jgi:hypothetical protein
MTSHARIATRPSRLATTVRRTVQEPASVRSLRATATFTA